MTSPIDKTQIACSMEQAQERIKDNWLRVRREVAAAAIATGRGPDAVQIVGVTKYVDAEIMSWLIDAGCHDVGENRPQSLVQKHAWLVEHRADVAQGVRWHQIGHLQRNKVRRLLPTKPLIHSVNSERLLDEIDVEAQRQSIAIDVLMEINVSGEEAKTGLPQQELAGILDRFCAREVGGDSSSSGGQTGGAQITGLMAMAGWGIDSRQAQTQFARLRELRDAMQQRTGLELTQLSMGMSGDYQAAVAEGATMVRIGSSLFEGVLA